MNNSERLARDKQQLPNGDIRPSALSSGPISKYKHYLAVHSNAKVSCLSPGSPDTPSFVGFRNLMILVICTASPGRVQSTVAYDNCSGVQLATYDGELQKSSIDLYDELKVTL